jgi:ParB-like chromosome segregation protein Spo0J
MGPFEYEKLLESMERFGFTDPVTVRPNGVRWELIDGEHRLRAAEEKGIKVIPYLNVGPISDDEAIALGIILNELKGRHDPKKLGSLLDDLLAKGSPEEVLAGMPFTPEALAGLTSLSSFDWSSLESKTPTAPKPSPRKGSSWVERTFRLPDEVNLVLDEAIEKAKDGDEIEDWQALERVAADFLAN